ncbi:MAG: inositol monophosphatase [Chloroflexi bacterium]|nr:inositol monophosphatase [Chloroflexota bacterium]
MTLNNLPVAKSGKNHLDVAIQAAKGAGEILLFNFGSRRQVKRKGQGNLVTEADLLSEKFIIEFLTGEYPDCNILSEESNASAPITDCTWVVDPLDGTNNYVFGVPFFCVNVALVKGEDILLGVTYDPLRGELFRAEKGRGAYLNDSPVQVSKESSFKAAMIGFDLGYSREQGKGMLGVADKLWWQVHCMRLMGSSALGMAYVACGRLSLYYHRFLFPWDIASGLLLVREAGGKVTDWQGNPASYRSREIVASNSKLHRKFMAHLAKH